MAGSTRKLQAELKQHQLVEHKSTTGVERLRLIARTMHVSNGEGSPDQAALPKQRFVEPLVDLVGTGVHC